MRVVIVDDDSVITSSLTSLLEGQGFDAQSFCTGQEALEFLEAEHCDVVITDLNMPGMNGYELTLAIKSKTPDLPVILYSGNAKAGSISKWRNSRFFAAILMKPTPFTKLVECINRVTSNAKLESSC